MAHSLNEVPEGIFSLLDTDLYKLTMQNAVLQHFPDVDVRYKFTNRTAHMRLTRAAVTWLQNQITRLANITLTSAEREWLSRTCPYLKDAYLDFLQDFRFQPDRHVHLTFTPAASSEHADPEAGDLDISITGRWVDTILYEIPLLALTSEAYFKFVDRNWDHAEQQSKAQAKGEQLLRAGCVFSEFGSRRRRDYTTHELVMRGLVDAQVAAHPDWKGKLGGTSNVHFAMRFGVPPVGTVAHEWFMGIAAITNDYATANTSALQYWIATYGRGVLSIALTDTFGTPAFLRAFAQPAPQSGTLTDVQPGRDPSYAEIFTGVRQDSGDPRSFVQTMREFYEGQGLLAQKKLIVFSDSLNIARCIEYQRATEDAGLTPSFGIGTFFTNDFLQKDGVRPADASPPKSLPLNIVIKLSEAHGRPAIKLSDDVSKNMGDDDFMRDVKAAVGYEEQSWKEADEAHRWDK